MQAAVNAVATGGSVVVCGGTYTESVSITRKVNRVGQNGATINGTGQQYAIGVGASYSSISGVTVENANSTADGAPDDGILTAAFTAHGPVAADHVSISGVSALNNNGSGIDINSTQGSTVTNSIANGNGVGINVADDLGRTTSGNTISNNTTDLNHGGCGIALADHTGAGVTGNVVSGNRSDDNGLSTPTAPDASADSGVILASPIPGGIVTNNTITGNSFNGNGHGGVVIHAHAPSNFAGNVITANRIKTNNVRTDSHDTQTTGIYIGTVSPLTITISDNTSVRTTTASSPPARRPSPAAATPSTSLPRPVTSPRTDRSA